jgi:hypothetical protein
MKITYVFNPFTGNLDAVTIPPSRAEFVKSILLVHVENAPTPEILFDENSILYEDDGYVE